MDQDRQEPTPAGSVEIVQRRGLIASVLGLLAAGLLGRSDPARAADGDALLLGKANQATSPTRLELGGRTGLAAVEVVAPDRSGNVPSVSVLGNADANTGRFLGNVGDKWPPPDTGGEVWAPPGTGFDVTPGEMPLNFAAVLGESAEIGVFGNSPRGTGVWGASESNIGTWGVSNTGIGVLGQTYVDPESPSQSYPPAGVFGVGGPQVGVWGVSSSNIAVWGVSADKGIGVAGQSPNIGGWFMIGSAPADFFRTLEPAALHTTAFGHAVSGCFRAEKGVAAMAQALDPEGVALMTMGRIQSDMVGAGTIRRGEDAVFVQCNGFRPTSHAQVTLTSDVGTSSFWVEGMPGKGFVLHLDKRAKRDGTFTYSVVEAMQPHQHPA